jgi:hypothetical protein
MGSIWEDAPAIPTGGAYALQGRCRATPAGAIPSSPARWGGSGGQDRPGRPNPRGLRRDRCHRLWIKAEVLEVLNEDWEAACFVEKML